jgi:hypothetical protein
MPPTSDLATVFVFDLTTTKLPSNFVVCHRLQAFDEFNLCLAFQQEA